MTTKRDGGGAPRLGHFVTEFMAPATIYSLRNAGYDFVVLDTEHSGKGFSDLAFAVALARSLGLEVIIRVPAKSPDYISRALDIGATGLLVPMVESGDEAQAIVKAALYPPRGRRGVALQIAHDDYRGGDPAEKLKGANASVKLFLQIESVHGVATVEQIAEVDGVSGLWIGHFDLSVTQGIPGQFSDPRFVEAVARVEAACRKSGRIIARLGGSADECIDLYRRGYGYVAYSGDIWAYQIAVTAAAAAIREGTSRH
jgi:2-dehydro-3-deoxyglucarate aldolase/4-hydroxy-2-oxoheptanedioate aldolase